MQVSCLSSLGIAEGASDWLWRSHGLEAKRAGTVSAHRATANPSRTAPGKVKRAGLCLPESGSSLTSALEFLGVEEEIGLIMGLEDA